LKHYWGIAIGDRVGDPESKETVRQFGASAIPTLLRLLRLRELSLDQSKSPRKNLRRCGASVRDDAHIHLPAGVALFFERPGVGGKCPFYGSSPAAESAPRLLAAPAVTILGLEKFAVSFLTRAAYKTSGAKKDILINIFAMAIFRQRRGGEALNPARWAWPQGVVRGFVKEISVFLRIDRMSLFW
jgi:hypothetical protein